MRWWGWGCTARRVPPRLVPLRRARLPASSWWRGRTATSVPTAASIPKRGEFDCNGDSPVETPARPGAVHGRPRHPRRRQRQHVGRPLLRQWEVHRARRARHDLPLNPAGLGEQRHVERDVARRPVGGARPSARPGKDVADWFELSPAPWFSMAMCDPYSYPQLPCVPESDTNAPSCPNAFNCPNNSYPGGGSAVMEMQLYPPGNPPWVDNESCSDAGVVRRHHHRQPGVHGPLRDLPARPARSRSTSPSSRPTASPRARPGRVTPTSTAPCQTATR